MNKRKVTTTILLWGWVVIFVLLIGGIGWFFVHLGQDINANAIDLSVCSLPVKVTILQSTSSQQECSFLRYPGKGCESNLPVLYCSSDNACSKGSSTCVPIEREKADELTVKAIQKAKEQGITIKSPFNP